MPSPTRLDARSMEGEGDTFFFKAGGERVLDPDRPIVDAHHHLWSREDRPPYLLKDLRGDTDTGHRVEKTVFVECLSGYRTDGPEAMRCVGETELVRSLADVSRERRGSRIAAIVGAADLRQGDWVEDILSAHIAAGGGLFRGIRHAANWDALNPGLRSHHNAPPHLYLDMKFRSGFARLAPAGLSFDALVYHSQIADVTDLARAFPDTKIVLDHLGGPLGVGYYADRRAEVFADWRRELALLAMSENVSIKLGGMAMPFNGYGWHEAASPPSAQDLVEAQGDFYAAAIDLFSPSRCMFESNFPVEKASVPYSTLWNAFKIIASAFTDEEKDEMFSASASRFYKLDD